jgi:divalent metal cation (Fe/Co/Zn/Cd) transporter
VLLSVVIHALFPQLIFVDAVTTVILAGLILHAAWGIGADALKELIVFSPSLKIVALVEEMAERVPEVTFIHNLRIRTMGGALYVELYAETDAFYHRKGSRDRREDTSRNHTKRA